MQRLLLLLGMSFLLLTGQPAAAAVKVVPLETLPGVTVWLAEDHSVSIVAMTATLPAGSAYDPADKAGLAALAARLLEDGAGRFDTGKTGEMLADHGVELMADPDRDRLSVSLRVLSEDARTAFRSLGRALSSPRFSEEAVSRLRLAMVQDAERGREDPATVAWNSLNGFYFGPHPYGHPVFGVPSSLAAITAADVRRFAKKHWTRGGLLVAISGDVDAETARSLVKAAFGALPEQATPYISPPAMTGAPGLHQQKLNVPQADAIFALPGPRRHDRDYLPAVIANEILGAGENSRLVRALRESRGLTYDVTTEIIPYARAGILIGEVQATKDDMREVLALIRATLRKFAMEGPTAREFADAKLYLRESFPLDFTSNADIAEKLALIMADGMPLDYVQNHSRMIDDITLADVRRAAKRFYASERLTIVVAGPMDKEKHSSNPYRR